jgi:hypothetical protein
MNIPQSDFQKQVKLQLVLTEGSFDLKIRQSAILKFLLLSGFFSNILRKKNVICRLFRMQRGGVETSNVSKISTETDTVSCSIL